MVYDYEYEFKKCVRFVPDDELVDVRPIETSNAAENLFFSDEEYKKSKEETLREVKAEEAQRFADDLEGTFVEPTEDVQRRLNHYTRKSDCRGVERLLCKSHFEERKLHREHAIKAILIGQDMAKQQGLRGDVLCEQLRKVALLYCLDAKIFARRLGKADEAACYSRKAAMSEGVGHTAILRENLATANKCPDHLNRRGVLSLKL